MVLTDDYLKFTLYQSSKTCEIGVKPGVVLEGKITLPVSYTSNGEVYPVVAVANGGFEG